MFFVSPVIIVLRIVMKFLVKLEKNANETHSSLKEVDGNECLSRARVFECCQRFQDGQEDIEDDSRPDYPATSKTNSITQEIGNLSRSDGQLSIRAIAEM